jgi:hypothetical protein
MTFGYKGGSIGLGWCWVRNLAGRSCGIHAASVVGDVRSHSSPIFPIFVLQMTTMNRPFSFLIVTLLALGCSFNAPDTHAQTVKAYGDAITTDNAIGTADLLKSLTLADSVAATVKCEIITSCTKKGCWMTVKLPDGGDMMVRFLDYGFFVPTQGLEGRQCVMKGWATKETVDVATLRHYAEDAGKSKEEITRITEPETNLMFLAEGVQITF